MSISSLHISLTLSFSLFTLFCSSCSNFDDGVDLEGISSTVIDFLSGTGSCSLLCISVSEVLKSSVLLLLKVTMFSVCASISDIIFSSSTSVKLELLCVSLFSLEVASIEVSFGFISESRYDNGSLPLNY